MIHVLRNGEGLCSLYLGSNIGDEWIAVESTSDPNILKVTCSECLANLHYDLQRLS
jgi:hypothetical protein